MSGVQNVSPTLVMRDSESNFSVGFSTGVSGILKCDSNGTIAVLFLWEIFTWSPPASFLGWGNGSCRKNCFDMEDEPSTVWDLAIWRALLKLNEIISLLFAMKPLLSETCERYIWDTPWSRHARSYHMLRDVR